MGELRVGEMEAVHRQLSPARSEESHQGGGKQGLAGARRTRHTHEAPTTTHRPGQAVWFDQTGQLRSVVRDRQRPD